MVIKYSPAIPICQFFTQNINTTILIIMHTSFQCLVYNVVGLAKLQKEKGTSHHLMLIDSYEMGVSVPSLTWF